MKNISRYMFVFIALSFSINTNCQIVPPSLQLDEGIKKDQHISPAKSMINCGNDTVMYTLSKATSTEWQTVNNPVNYEAVAQRYEVPQEITVHGLCFYAITDTSADGPSSVEVFMYDLDTNSLPGAILASGSIDIPEYTSPFMIDNKHCVSWSVPVTMSSDFYVGIDASGTDEPLGVRRNSYTSSNGAGEALSAVYYDDGSGMPYVKWYNQTSDPLFAPGWDFDYLIEPIVSYDFVHDASASVGSICPNDEVCVSSDFTSSIFSHKMYNQNSGILPDTDWGDGNISEGDSVCNIYTAAGDYTIAHSLTLTGWTNNCTVIENINLLTNDNTGTDVITDCGSHSWIDGNIYSENNNTATYTLTNAMGCDSVVTLDLTINNVDVSLTTSDLTITANASGATYQWLDCDNNNVEITGETEQSFTAVSSGNYAVQVTQNGCTDTSSCTPISIVGLDENIFKHVTIFPNPNDGIVNIDLGKLSGIDIKIHAIDGKVVYNLDNVITPSFQFELDESAGIYFVELRLGELTKRFKLAKK